MTTNDTDATLIISELPDHRKHRLMALTYSIAHSFDEANPNNLILRLIKSVSDHKGDLTVTWRVEPTSKEKEWVASQWEDIGEANVTHIFEEKKDVPSLIMLGALYMFPERDLRRLEKNGQIGKDWAVFVDGSTRKVFTLREFIVESNQLIAKACATNDDLFTTTRRLLEIRMNMMQIIETAKNEYEVFKKTGDASRQQPPARPSKRRILYQGKEYRQHEVVKLLSNGSALPIALLDSRVREAYKKNHEFTQAVVDKILNAKTQVRTPKP